MIILANVLVMDPGLQVERSQLQAGTKKWDVALASFVAMWGPLLTWLVAGLDQRWGWSKKHSPVGADQHAAAGHSGWADGNLGDGWPTGFSRPRCAFKPSAAIRWFQAGLTRSSAIRGTWAESSISF